MGFLLWLVAFAAHGQQAQPVALDGPVDIRSERLTVMQKKRQAVFSGNVQVIQDQMHLRCDELTVTYQQAKEKESGSGEIQSMVFTGSVEITQGQRRGRCDRLDYDRPRAVMVCTGNPWVIEGENRIEGDRIEFLLERDEVKVVNPRAVLRLPETVQKGQKEQKGPIR